MVLRYPSFYHPFSCIAGDCPDSCCHEWDVQVDADAAARWRSWDGPLGDDLRRSMYEEAGEIYLRNENGRCPMWRTDGLCRIQAERGHASLCTVCQQFPRLRHDYGDFVELGLELSCPEAARMLLTQDWEWVEEDLSGGEEPEYDGEIMDILLRSRPVALALLRDQALSVPDRLTALLMLGAQIQSQIDGAEEMEFDPEAAIETVQNLPLTGDFGLLADFYGNLDILTSRWQTRLETLGDIRWDEMLCKFAEHTVCRHWLQAVSDWDLSCRVKLILSGCILLSRMPGDLVENVQLWSKEIENSADNLDALLDGAWTAPALTDANLLGLLR